MQNNVRAGEQSKPFFDGEKREYDQRKIDRKQDKTLRNRIFRCRIDQNGDTGNAADREVVRGDQGIRGKGHEKSGEQQHERRLYM